MQNSLRPTTFEKFIGQRKIVNTIKVMIQSSIKRKKQLDHIMLYGGAGVGKTTLATIISNEYGRKIKFAQGPLLEKKADILSLFASLNKGDIIFIDEIHGINKNAEELLYSALEDNVMDVLVGPEGDQKIMRMNMPPFTLIGATTQYTKISQPLRDRFGLVGKLVDYDESEIYQIVKNSAKELKFKVNDEAIKLISHNSRMVPRVANNLLKRTHDFAVVKDSKIIDKDIVLETFESIGLYKLGLLEQHLSYLKLLANNFEEKWVSIDTISGILNEQRNELEKDIEPILISNGLIQKGPRGRKITNEGIHYITTYNIKL